MIEEKTKKIIGNRIEKAIKKNGIKQKALANKLGYFGSQENTVSLWISGKRSPSIEQLIAIANECGTTVDYLVGNTDIFFEESNLKVIWSDTGLSDSSFETLSYLNISKKNYVSFINFLLEQIPLQYFKDCDEMESMEKNGASDEELMDFDIVKTEDLEKHSKAHASFFFNKLIDYVSTVIPTDKGYLYVDNNGDIKISSLNDAVGKPHYEIKDIVENVQLDCFISELKKLKKLYYKENSFDRDKFTFKNID